MLKRLAERSLQRGVPTAHAVPTDALIGVFQRRQLSGEETMILDGPTMQLDKEAVVATTSRVLVPHGEVQLQPAESIYMYLYKFMADTAPTCGNVEVVVKRALHFCIAESEGKQVHGITSRVSRFCSRSGGLW